VLAGALAAAAVAFALRPAAWREAPAAALTARVERRDFVRSLRVAGVVEAVTSTSVVAPRLARQAGSMIVTKLVASGAVVRQGDVLAEFDRQAQVKDLRDHETEYLQRMEDMKKKDADAVAAAATDEKELQQAEHAVASAELDVRRNEILSSIDAEKNNQALEEARARLTQVRKTVELRRRSFEAARRIIEIQRERARLGMEQARRNCDRMVLRAPQAGVVVLSTIFKSNGPGEVQEGDEVRPGVGLLQVIDPGAMQVRARVNQLDVLGLQAGQSATVHLDAYPDTAFPGHLRQIGALALRSVYSETLRSVTVLLTIEGSDPRLMPDLSAAIDVELERRPGALVAPRDAIFEEAGRAFVRVQRGASFEAQPVTLGGVSEHEAVIASGLAEGAVVLRGPLPPRGAS
jgi:multidrug efflux pump subunit AcrA (membrane-fusion protein)